MNQNNDLIKKLEEENSILKKQLAQLEADKKRCEEENQLALMQKLELLLSDDVAKSDDIQLTDIISIEHLQSLQNKFSIANGVSSVITNLDGVSITKPSNFNDVCTSVFYSGEECFQAGKLLHDLKTTSRPCKLSDAKAPIYIGGKHVANWKIGMCGFGGAIAPFVKAACDTNEKYTEIYTKSLDGVKVHFGEVCNLLEVMANEISSIGYNNVRLAYELTKRKENESKLAESETTFRSIFDNSVDGIFLTNADGIIEEWSRGYERLSGISKEQTEGKNIWEVIKMMLSPDRYNETDMVKMQEQLNDIISRKEQTVVTRYIINQKTKEEQITHTLYFPVCLPGATMIGAISRDATDDIRNKQRLTENNALLEGIMNTIPAPIFVKDTNGSYIKFNNAFLKASGFTYDQLEGKKVGQIYVKESIPIEQREAKMLANANSEQPEIDAEITTYKDRDGVIYRSVFFDEAGGVQGIVGVIFDSTELKKAERQLILEKERLQALGDNYPDGCLYRTTMDIRTKKLKVTYLSKPWEILSGGIAPQAAIDDINIVMNLIFPEDLPMFREALINSSESLANMKVEIRFWLEDKSIKWAQVSAHPHIEEGLVVWDGYILDITERKNNELKLEAYRTDLEFIVRERTEELEAANEELYATNEELYATNEEFAVTNEELHQKNHQLHHEMAARKEVMQKLEDSESKMRNFIAQSFEGIVILDEEGKVVEWNAAQERITGISSEKALGEYAWELYRALVSEEVAMQRTEQFRSEVLACIKAGANQEAKESEHTLYPHGNDERYITMTSFPIGLADKCYLGEIVRDITEQKLVDIELERYRTQLEEMVVTQTKELIESKERLTSLSDNLPGGAIFQIYDKAGHARRFTYVSAHFVNMFHIDIDEVMADSELFFNLIHPDDLEKFNTMYTESDQVGFVDLEYRVRLDTGETKWIHLRVSYHATDSDTYVWDGFMIDITDKKNAEQELEETRKRQNILIKVLQIVQSTDDIPEAINVALSEIGKYAGVSRSYIFEKSADGKTASNTYEWSNEGVVPEKDNLQDVPIEFMADWFETFEKGQYICASDIATLSKTVYDQLVVQGIKSILVLPLIANGGNYGFVGFDECSAHKEWQQKEVELLISLSQIISTTTRRLWAERSTQLSQQTMRTVLDNINASIYVADFNTYEVLFANKMIKQQMGEEVEGKKCWKVLQNQDSPCDFCPNPKLLDENKKPTGLYRWEVCNRNLGRMFECTDAAIEWVDGRVVHMEYATDITDRKEAEEALQQSEELYRQLTVASPDAIVVCDPKGKVVFVSPRARELFHINEDTDMDKLKMKRYVHPHDLRKAVEMFRLFVQDNVSFLPQMLLMREDGTDFFGEISSASVKDDNGTTTSVIMVIRDITERKMSEMELIRAKEKAEESDKLKSAFLANMSHEIRTPINGIIGFLNFLADDHLAPKRRQEYITVVNNSSVQLVKLIDDIIDVAKIEAKQMSIRPIPFQLNGFMRELQVFFETYLQANNKEKIALILDDYEFIDPSVTYVDPMRLRQVLTNLIGNAIKFTEKGFIQFGYRLLQSGKLEFWVEDSGIGLAVDQREVIFERFRQAELTNSRRYGGTGLGLTISRSLVQMMGGDISVESVENVGSTFKFTISYLPVNSEDAPLFDDIRAEDEQGDKPFKNLSVLLVEPEVVKSKYYEKLLSSKGATLIYAQTARQWIDTISQRKQISLVLADAQVFENESSEIVKQVKSVRAGLPLVLLVPERNEYYNRLICDSQCNKVIDGPVGYDKLFDALRKYV